jgi:hypothetical protein
MVLPGWVPESSGERSESRYGSSVRLGLLPNYLVALEGLSVADRVALSRFHW